MLIPFVLVTPEDKQTTIEDLTTIIHFETTEDDSTLEVTTIPIAITTQTSSCDANTENTYTEIDLPLDGLLTDMIPSEFDIVLL